MFSFFKRKPKAESAGTPEPSRRHPTATNTPVQSRASQHNDITQKDVVNLLLPDTSYQKTGASFLQIMGRKKRNKRKRDVKVQEKPNESPTPAKNTRDESDAADFVKAIVLQKYAKPETKQQHVSCVYVNQPSAEEKRHTEALLSEIAKRIDCKLDVKQMGTEHSKEAAYENVTRIDTYKNELRGELEMLLKHEAVDDNKIDNESLESSAVKKSNLKPPKTEEGCSDDDRSDSGKKRVTFRKRVVFDDGDEQTDEEVDSSFESITSEETEYLDDVPDNDELLGGYVVDKTVIEPLIKVDSEQSLMRVDYVEQPLIKVDYIDNLSRVDNSDSGFIECDKESGDETSDVKSIVGSDDDDGEMIDDIDEESEGEIVEADSGTDAKDLVNQESRLQKEVSALSSLADSRCEEVDRARDIISTFRKEIEAKEQEIEQLRCDLASAYKESELIRQRSRSLEDELTAARSCSADLADQLNRRNDEAIRNLGVELQDVNTRCGQLAARVEELETDKHRLQQEMVVQEQRAQEALSTAEANTSKWRLAHESARSQAAARAERILSDCEWKMRELEKRARDAEKEKKELSDTVEQLKTSTTHKAELQQLRGLASEQQRSVQALSSQLQRVQDREEGLVVEVRRLEEVLEKQGASMREKEKEHAQLVEKLNQQHSQQVEGVRAEHAATLSRVAAARAALERAHSEATRTALADLRHETEKDVRNAERKLREATVRFDNLKEVLASKESQFEETLAETHSKADWEVMQLRHLLDKADIKYANKVEALNERYEKEIDRLNEEWSSKLRLSEEQAELNTEEAHKLLESTRAKLVADRLDIVNKLRNQHQKEMDEQWEQFMTDKENCLERMKAECRQEGDEQRVKRERELLEEIAELKSQVQSKSNELDDLSATASSCGRTLAVTEQELREALEREKSLRQMRGEDASKLTQVEKASREQIEHLTRKCACLRKLFDDMRARLSSRERAAEQDARAKDKEIQQLRAEVARLTKLLMEQSSSKLGTRTRADGCETLQKEEKFTKESQTDIQTNATRRKGSLRTPELARKRPTLPELQPLPPESRPSVDDEQNGRRRAKSVDLPAVQVPVRIKQLQERNNEK